MAQFDPDTLRFIGEAGSLPVLKQDEICLKLAMLLAGECDGLGPSRAAALFGFSTQRYFQLRQAFADRGAAALASQRRGPKTHYRRTPELTCQTLRHRLLDPEASSEVIAQKLRQSGFRISKRSVDRIFAEFGFQKKTLPVSARPRRGSPR